MLTEKEQITIASYNQYAPYWVETHTNSEQCLVEFNTFKKYLPGGEVLEIGSGGGREADRFRKAGYGYIGIDSSKALLTEARKNAPGAKLFFREDIYNLNFPVKFDGFWCSATLLHNPKERITEALQSIYGVIKSGGIGFICIKEGAGNMVPNEEEVFGKKILRYFTYYRQDEFAKRLTNAEFSILESSTLTVSPKTTWLNYFVQK